MSLKLVTSIGVALAMVFAGRAIHGAGAAGSEPRPLGKGSPGNGAFLGPYPAEPIAEPTGHLTLREALALALKANPQLAPFSREIRAREAAALQAGLLPNPELGAVVPSEIWQQDCSVNCQAVPNAEASIQYLAPYVFKVAISDHRILKVEETSVSFSYKKPGSARLRTLTLDPHA